MSCLRRPVVVPVISPADSRGLSFPLAICSNCTRRGNKGPPPGLRESSRPKWVNPQRSAAAEGESFASKSPGDVSRIETSSAQCHRMVRSTPIRSPPLVTTPPPIEVRPDDLSRLQDHFLVGFDRAMTTRARTRFSDATTKRCAEHPQRRTPMASDAAQQRQSIRRERSACRRFILSRAVPASGRKEIHEVEKTGLKTGTILSLWATLSIEVSLET